MNSKLNDSVEDLIRKAKQKQLEKSKEAADQPRKQTVFDRYGYTVGKDLGSGSYAKVKMAYSNEFQGIVALKMIVKQKASRVYLHRFLPREIEVVKGLEHENIVQYYQCIETTHRVIIIMEYAENGTMLDYLVDQTDGLPESTACKYFRQLTNAVAYCHMKNIVHRDLKLENLLLDKCFNLKLVDFGFARRLDAGNELSRTFCGSNAYASPEILKSIPYDPKMSDCWAVGVILYAMVFGQLPFDDKNGVPDLIQQIERGVVFADQNSVSSECKNLLRKLIAPIGSRIHVSEAAIEPWVCQQCVQRSTV